MKMFSFDFEIATMKGTEKNPKPPEVVKGVKYITAANRREAEKDLTIFLYRTYKPDMVRFPRKAVGCQKCLAKPLLLARVV